MWALNCGKNNYVHQIGFGPCGWVTVCFSLMHWVQRLQQMSLNCCLCYLKRWLILMLRQLQATVLREIEKNKLLALIFNIRTNKSSAADQYQSILYKTPDPEGIVQPDWLSCSIKSLGTLFFFYSTGGMKAIGYQLEYIYINKKIVFCGKNIIIINQR